MVDSAEGGQVDEQPLLRLHAVADHITTLGPAPAAVVWTQGCGLPVRCRDCMSPETWSATGGVLARPSAVADWLLGLSTRFLTISGGEPTDQAPAMNALLGRLGERGGDDSWVVTLFSGHDHDALLSDERPGVAELLSRIDLLVAGPYLPERHVGRRWLASDNQVMVDLTGRARIPDDRTAGVSFRLTPAGVEVVGIPPRPGFVVAWRAAAAEEGLTFRPSAAPVFPFPLVEEPGEES